MKNRNYLAHHGVLGQKWGTRNGPPYPLDAADHSASERKAGWQNSLKERKDEIEKNIRAGAEVKFREANPTYSDEQIQKKVKDYIKIGKRAIAVGAFAATAYIGLKAYRHGSTYLDGEIKAGQILQRVERYPVPNLTGGIELHDSFYASYNKADNALYRKMLGDPSGSNNRWSRMVGLTPKIMEMEAVSPIKIANHKTARKLYEEFYANYTPNVLPSDYKKFNNSLASRPNGGNEFYSFLKSKGYSALMDIRDQRYSKLNAKAPIIVFDKSAVKINSIKEYSDLSLGRKAADTALISGKIGMNVLESPDTAVYVAAGAAYAALFASDAKTGAAKRNKK